MKKRRSIVYVSPGKDVTLYVPAETPPEVIEFLNRLKLEGTFSQGVMEIVTKYVQEQRAIAAAGAVEPEAGAAGSGSDAEAAADWFEHVGGRLEGERGSDLSELTDPAGPVPHPVPPKPFNLAQIFRQASANSGKLSDSSRESQPETIPIRQEGGSRHGHGTRQ